MGTRLAAAAGLSMEAVAFYQPLLFPLAQQLGGFFFLAYGLAPRRTVSCSARGLLVAPVLDQGAMMRTPVSPEWRTGSTDIELAAAWSLQARRRT
jgi:hypothetical protein